MEARLQDLDVVYLVLRFRHRDKKDGMAHLDLVLEDSIMKMMGEIDELKIKSL